jgi:hypothetical protein
MDINLPDLGKGDSMNGRGKILLFALAGVLSGAQAGFADSITGLNNTGGNGATADGANDPNYTLAVAGTYGTLAPADISALTFTTPAIVTDQTSFMFTQYWIADQPTSKWISPQAYYAAGSANSVNPGGYDSNPADYVFQTTFNDAIGGSPSSAISGVFAADNNLIQIFLNDALVATISPSYLLAFSPFSITSGFQNGKNTLDFVVENYGVQNYGNPAGIQVAFTGVVPLPASALSGSALLGLMYIAKARSRKSA